MTDINEIIGRALFENSPDTNSTAEQAAAVVKALGEAGYKIVEDNAGPACTVCGAAAGLACNRQDCGALIK